MRDPLLPVPTDWNPVLDVCVRDQGVPAARLHEVLLVAEPISLVYLFSLSLQVPDFGLRGSLLGEAGGMEESSATEVGVRPFRLGPGGLAESFIFFHPGVEKN